MATRDGRLLERNIRGNNRVARRYDGWHPEIFSEIEQRRLREALAAAKAGIRCTGAEGLRALDFGCGSGNLTRHLLDLGFEVVAADVAERFLDVVRERFGDSVGLRTMVLNGEDLREIPDGSFDLVATYSVLHHVPDYLAAVREMHRVLKPGGVVYLDHEASPAYWTGQEEYATFLEGVVERPPRTWRRFFRPRNYWNKLRDAYLSLAGYCDQGDIHVTAEDHIDWDAIARVLGEAGCVVQREDYLLYREGYDVAVYEAFAARCDDVSLLRAVKPAEDEVRAVPMA